MKVLRLLGIKLLSLLESLYLGDDGGFLCFVVSPTNDSDLMELVRALARAAAREDHRKVSFEREIAIERKEPRTVVREKAE